MPARDTLGTTQRFLTLLKLIPPGLPGKTASALHEQLEGAGFPVSERSVQRDLEAISKVFPLKCDRRSKPYGWHWSGDAMGFSDLSIPEALALLLVEKHLHQALPATMGGSFKSIFDRARAKMRSLGPNNKQPKWLSKVRVVSQTMGSQPPRIDRDIHAVISDAVVNELQIEAVYRAAEREQGTSIVLNPLGLLLRGPTLYVVATTNRGQQVRLYAMHRFLKAVGLTSTITKPKGFDIDAHLADGLGQFGPGTMQKLRLEVHCAKWLVRQCEETPLGADQKIRRFEDGSGIVSATVFDSWQLKWWVLARLGDAEVIAPAGYRKSISDLLKQSAAGYGTRSRNRLGAVYPAVVSRDAA